MMIPALNPTDWSIEGEEPNTFAVKQTPPPFVPNNRKRDDGPGTCMVSVNYKDGMTVRLGTQEFLVKGLRIPQPVAPSGYEIKPLGCANFNSFPPFRTFQMRKAR